MYRFSQQEANAIASLVSTCLYASQRLTDVATAVENLETIGDAHPALREIYLSMAQQEGDHQQKILMLVLSAARLLTLQLRHVDTDVDTTANRGISL